ncbi:hypothetical protein N2152v2_000067 [Parachlorella kessleri]
MRTRLLLQADYDAQLPTCEIDLKYRVMQLEPEEFTSLLTITNNREMDMTHWQVVWRYADYEHLRLGSAQGAIVLTAGSPAGGPVRVVDTYTSDGIPSSGGSYTFMATTNLTQHPSSWGPWIGTLSAAIGSVNVNGLACTEVVLPGMEQLGDKCWLPAPDTSSDAAREPADDVQSEVLEDGCKAAFCCGVVLLNPSQFPPPPPPPRVSDSPSLPAATPPTSPPAPADSAVPAAPGQGQQQALLVPDDLTGGISHAGMVAALAGVLGGTAVLAVGVLLAWRGLRHRHRLVMHKRSFSMGANAPSSSPAAAGPSASLQQQPPGHVGTVATVRLAAGPDKKADQPPCLAREGSAGAAAAAVHDAPSPDCACGACVAAAGQSEAGLASQVVLGKALGAGAFGRVYAGTWAGRPVAVKMLQTACHASSRELHSFKQEVAVLSQLRHPHIVAFLAACTEPPSICIVEELVAGGSLHDRLHGRHPRRRKERQHQQQPLSYTQVLQIAMDVASAMAYLHPKVVHRDLKSQNVLLSKDGRAKVCDFGIAKFKDRTFISTVNGQGTPAYMAPEMFDGHRVTEKVDVFSFGVLLWEMLTGELPWSQVPAPVQIIYYVGVLQHRPPIPADCPPAFRGLIERCWADSPSARPAFPEILEMLHAEHAAVLASSVPAAAGGKPEGEGEQQPQLFQQQQQQ